MDSIVGYIEIKIDEKALEPKYVEKLKSFRVQQNIGSNGTATLTFYDSLTQMQDNDLFEFGKTISIKIGNAKDKKIIFQGDIKKLAFNSGVEASDEIILTCHDFLHRLSKIKISRNFVKMTMSQIAKQMADDAKLKKNKIDTTKKKYDSLTQTSKQDNLSFLRNYAEEIGFEVEMNDNGGLFFAKPRYLNSKKSGISLKWGETLMDFDANLSLEGILTEVTVSSQDTDDAKEGAKSITATAKAGDEKKVGTPKTLGTELAAKKMVGKDMSQLIIEDRPSLTEAEAKDMAVAKLTEASMEFLQITGKCVGQPKFKLGTLLEIKGVGKRLSGEYYITEYTHDYGLSGFTTSFGAKANGTFG